ncbi:YraN family protein [Synechococcus sp. UW140]|uniref:YraN family protein n=1 Tax=Synechococcus sp. UW140 TaxID=368503 RepID=UPI001FCC3A6F|nr:YraN family protein [Synechococcus sp. UW140]
MVLVRLDLPAMLSPHDGLDRGLWAERRSRDLLVAHGWCCVDQRWRCRYGEIDLLMLKSSGQKQRLLVVEVKGRRRCGRDAWGLSAFNATKRRRLFRAVDCWRQAHPWSDDFLLELILALVPLPPAHGPVRWIPLMDATPVHPSP